MESLAAAARERALLYRDIRSFFEERGFLEVETPLRVRSPGLEPHLEALGTSDGHYLITSPEYHMKRLLAEGLPRIFQIAKCFRAGEAGRWHHPEFSLLEWYRAEAGYDAIMADVEDLLRATLGTRVRYGERDLDLGSPAERLTTAEAFRRYAGIDWREHPTPGAFAQAANAAGFGPIPDGEPWDDIFHRIFVAGVEEQLGGERPTLLYGYPASMAALARIDPDDPRLALRFEVYLAGIELANAFDELVDPDEQRRRFEDEQAERARMGREVYPIDDKLLAALAQLGPSAGIALGVDRLLMLRTGAAEMGAVLPFGYGRL